MENKTVNRSDFDQFMVPNYAPMSFIPVRGEGSRIWDQQGQERVDLTGGNCSDFSRTLSSGSGQGATGASWKTLAHLEHLHQ